MLRPGGRLLLADVVVKWRPPRHVTENVRLWTDCIAGGTPLQDYMDQLERAGFTEIEVVETFDTFADTQIERQSSIFAARGANIRASRPD